MKKLTKEDRAALIRHGSIENDLDEAFHLSTSAYCIAKENAKIQFKDVNEAIKLMQPFNQLNLADLSLLCATLRLEKRVKKLESIITKLQGGKK